MKKTEDKLPKIEILHIIPTLGYGGVAQFLLHYALHRSIVDERL